MTVKQQATTIALPGAGLAEYNWMTIDWYYQQQKKIAPGLYIWTMYRDRALIRTVSDP